MSSQGSQKLPGAPKHSPKPWGGGGTSEQLYPHDVSLGRGTEIPLHSLHYLLTAIPATWPPSASCRDTCPVWAGDRESGESPFMWIVLERNMLF